MSGNLRLKHAIIQAIIFIVIYYVATFYLPEWHVMEWVFNHVYLYLLILCCVFIYLYKLLMSYAVSIGNLAAMLLAEYFHHQQLAGGISDSDFPATYVWFICLVSSMLLGFFIMQAANIFKLKQTAASSR